MSEEHERSTGSVIARRVVGIVVVIAGVVGWKYYNRSGASTEAREAVAASIRAMPIYEANRGYMDRLLSSVHESAFRESYHMGGRREAARFEPDRYALLVFTGMADRAEEDGLSEIAEAIREAHARYGAAPLGGRDD